MMSGTNPKSHGSSKLLTGSSPVLSGLIAATTPGGEDCPALNHGNDRLNSSVFYLEIFRQVVFPGTGKEFQIQTKHQILI